MEPELTGTTARVTGSNSGIGAATARQLAEHGASVALVARPRDRLEALAVDIDKAGGTALGAEIARGPLPAAGVRALSG